MYSFLFLMVNLTELLGALAICIYTTTPIVIGPILIIGYLANLLRNYYMKTQR